MPNLHKLNVVDTLRARFGEMRKVPGSDSLFTLGNEAARVYLRYSKVHENRRTFFGLREVDLRQLEGHNSFLGFILDDGSAPLFIPYADFEEIFRNAETAKDGQYKVQLTSQADARELYIARQGRFFPPYVNLTITSISFSSTRLPPTFFLPDMLMWTSQSTIKSSNRQFSMICFTAAFSLASLLAAICP